MTDDLPNIYATTLQIEHIRQIRICAMSSASASIAMGVIFFYFFGMIHPTRRHFRHYLILLLIIFDFIKAIAILVFSCLSFNLVATNNQSLIMGIGWLTVFGIEGADIVILMFAIHMALLIFNSQINKFKQTLDAKLATNFRLKLSFPRFNMNKNCKNRKGSLISSLLNNSASEKNSSDDESADHENSSDGFHHVNAIMSNMSKSVRKAEGGLYHYRYPVLAVIFLFPVLVSSVSFYINNTYEEFVYWSFFRVWTGPWYFSWTFRHVIVVTILVIYISIYIFVMSQFKSVSKSMKKKMSDINDDDYNDDDDDDDDEDEKNVMLNTFGDTLWYKSFTILSMLVFPDVHISAKLHGHGLDTEEDMINIEKLKNESVMTESINTNLNGNDNILGLSTYANVPNTEISKQIQNLLYEEAMERFTVRRSQIMRQMRVIFIYPLSFIILWLMPFINHYEVVRTGTESIWSTAPSAFFQPFNCFVDVLVFLLREKPWLLTTSIDEMTGISEYNNQGYYQLYGWRHYVSWLPGYRSYSGDLDSDSMTEMGTLASNTNKNTAENNNKNSISRATNRKNTYGRNSLGTIPYEEDEDNIEYRNDYGYETDYNMSSVLESYDSEDDNNNNEMDLKDFLNSPPRRTPKRKTRISYKSISKPKPTASSPNINIDGKRSSIASSNKSTNTNTNTRRDSRLSWRTWSMGSNKSNQYGNAVLHKDFEPISKHLTNNSGISDQVKIREDQNDVHWNLHMFENGQSKTYENNINNNGKSNNRKRSSHMSNATKSSGSGYMSTSSNGGFDDEMDLLDFLKMGPRG